MNYYCHSCQEQTQIIAAHYLACERCLSDFVEEIEPIQDNRTTWSDEDDTLASLWNSVFRQGFDDSSLPGSYPQQEHDNNELTGTAVPEDDDEEEIYRYAYGGYYQQHNENDEQEEYNSHRDDYFFFNNYQEHLNDGEESNTPWHTNNVSGHDSDDGDYDDDDDDEDDEDYQDVISNNSSSSNIRSSLDNDEESSAEYLSIRDIVGHDIGNEYVEYGSVSSEDDNDGDSYEDYQDLDYGSGMNRFHRFSYGDDSDEEEAREETTAEEEEEEEEEEQNEDSDMVGLSQLLRETLISSDVDIYPRADRHLFTNENEYDDPSEYYGSEFSIDPTDHLSTLLRIIQEQHETTFTDPSNWEVEINRQVQSASEELIAALPRHQLNRGDAATQIDCSICLNSLGFNVELINLPCMHGFHSGCIEQWLQVNASCPVCRSPCS